MYKCKKSFYDWCVENNHKDYIELWDYSLNSITPVDVSFSSSNKFYFKCLKGKHESELHSLNKLTSNKNKLFCHKCNSFGQWCLDNKQYDILNRWNYFLNNCSPFEVNKGSLGKNKKGYWFNCPKNLHDAELKSISILTGRNEYSIMNCQQCNSFGEWILNHIGNIELFWSTKNNISPFEVNRGSNKKYWINCPNCGTEKFISPDIIIRQGIGCNKCSDGESFPEKVMYSLLEQFNIPFKKEYSPKWIKPKRYDFYIPSKKVIIEMDGALGHGNKVYKYSKITKEESQKIDDMKDRLAKEHGIEVIRIDCKLSDIDYIKNNILNSDLCNMFDLSVINWDTCYNYTFNSIMIKACELWNNKASINTISNRLKKNESTIRNYLKNGNKINLCNYDTEIEIDKRNKRKSKEIFCIELNQKFSSIREAERITGVNRRYISWCCTGKKKYAGKRSDGIKFHWMYYEEYLKQQQVS